MIERLKDAGLHLAVRIAQGSTPTPDPGGPSTPTPTGGSVTIPPGLPNPSGGFNTIIVNVLTWGITIAGSVATLMLFVGGFMYVSAAGNESQIERAKKIIKGAIIGIIVMLLAGVIVTTVNYALLRGGSTTGTTTGTTTDQCGPNEVRECDIGGTNCRCIPGTFGPNNPSSQ